MHTRILHSVLAAACALALALLSPAAGQAAPPDGITVMQGVDRALGGPPEKLQVRMEIVRANGTTDVRTLSMWSKAEPGKARYALIRFESPSSIAGTALLSVLRGPGKEDHHLYLPSLGQTRRIAATDKREAFVQSDFSVEDLTVSLNPDARTYAVTGEVDCGEGRRCWLVEDRPRDEKAARMSGYGHVVLHVDQELYLVHRVDFFDQKGALLKVLRAGGLQKVGDVSRFNSVAIANVQTGSQTTMTVIRRESGAGIDDSVFSPASLGSL